MTNVCHFLPQNLGSSVPAAAGNPHTLSWDQEQAMKGEGCSGGWREVASTGASKAQDVLRGGRVVHWHLGGVWWQVAWKGLEASAKG